MDTWFEGTALLEESLKTADGPRQTLDSFRARLEERRGDWALLVLRAAHVLKAAGDADWRSFAAVASALLDGRAAQGHPDHGSHLPRHRRRLARGGTPASRRRRRASGPVGGPGRGGGVAGGGPALRCFAGLARRLRRGRGARAPGAPSRGMAPRARRRGPGHRRRRGPGSSCAARRSATTSSTAVSERAASPRTRSPVSATAS